MKALKERLKYDQIFCKSAGLPQSEEEIMEWFSKICYDLSPENLSCDGELSGAALRTKEKNLIKQWRELEALLGRKVSESDVYQWERQRK